MPIHSAEEPINSASLQEKSPNENYQEIARIKFKLGDKAIYDFPDQYHETPGTACLHLSWQPKKLPANKTKKIVYYRFSVEINTGGDTELSKAMQWFTNVEITHKGNAKAQVIKIERQLLPNLRYYCPQDTGEDALDIPLKETSTVSFDADIANIEHVPLNVNNKLFLISENNKTKEVISQDYKSVELFQYCKVTTTKAIYKHQIYTRDLSKCLHFNP